MSTLIADTEADHHPDEVHDLSLFGKTASIDEKPTVDPRLPARYDDPEPQ